MATLIRLSRKHLHFEFGITKGVPISHFNDFPALLKPEIEHWLNDQGIPFGFVYQRSISTLPTDETTKSGLKVKRSDVSFYFWLEFDNSQDAMLFRLAWS